MKSITSTTLTLGAALLCVSQATAQTVTVDPSTLTLGYMNWQPTANTLANFPGDGGTGASAWGLSPLQANFSGTTLTLQPNVNTYDNNPGSTYWINPDGSGANQMDASIYNESTGVYVNTTLTFNFDVLQNNLAAPYTSQAFIKEFAPNYSSYTQATVALTTGNESVSFLVSGNAADHVQYGFETFGPDTSSTSAAAAESVVIAPATVVPEPMTWTWASSGGALALAFLRRRRA